MKLGLSTYTYTWAMGVPGSPPEEPLTLQGLIDKTQEAGVSILQIADNFPVEEKLSEDDLKQLFNYAKEKGVNLEMGGRGLTPEHTLKCLRCAELMRSPLLRMVIDSTGFEPEINDIISIIRDLIPEFRKTGIQLAIENHDRLKARDFEKIIMSTSPETVGICLDSVNSIGAGEGFETVSEILLPYTINLHIKDFVIFRVPHKMGFIVEGRPAGKGMLNIPELINRTASYSRCKSAILELWTPPEESLKKTIIREEKWALESIQYLKTLLQ